MGKKRPEIMRAICESIADGVKPLDATLLAGLSERAFFNWLRQSKENATDPALIVDWEGSAVSFASAVQAARDIAANRGAKSPSASGANVVHHYHHFVFETASAPTPSAARQITPKAEPVAPVAASPSGDAELDEMLRLEPAPVAEPEVIPDEPEPEVIPDKPEPPAVPLAFDEPPNRPPRSALERDLLARLAAARAKNAPGPGKDTGQPEGGSVDSAMAPGGVSTG